MDSKIREISEHLEFLGYEISPSGDDGFRATHTVRPNFLARAFNGGCLLSAWYGTTAQAVVNREGLLEAINALNAGALVARFYVDKDFDFTAEAFYPVPYERTCFGRFIEMWDHDFTRVVESDIDQYLT